MCDTLVRLHHVAKAFGAASPALQDVSGSVMSGAITGLVGPDGAGKTTLIRLMTGLLLADRGLIEVLGVDPGAKPEIVHASIGYMPQRFGLYEDLSVMENLRLYSELRGLSAGEKPAAFEELLAFTNLGAFTGRLAGKLSGGMKQKLGLACALLRRPRLLLLDEPTVGVDPISRRALWRMVLRLRGEGVGVVWSTAYLDEAEACDRVLLLNAGRLLYDGPPRALRDRAKGRVFRVTGIEGSRRAALPGALSQPNIIDGVIQGESLRLLTSSGAVGPSVSARIGPGAKVEPIDPRFEDAFIDLLGGGQVARSKLAESRAPVTRRRDFVIEARGLTKRFGDFTAAEDITFQIPPGEVFGLLGPNGAGKSTTFRMLCGLLKPTAGDGRVAGFDLRRDTAEARSRLGYMAQKFSLYGDLTVGQNLEFFAGAYNLGGRRKRRQLSLMVDIFDLSKHLGAAAKDLPLGFKKRLALACAVIHEPEALFLDEPTSGVDPIMRREFWTHINGLVERGVAVLVTTHFMEEAEYCDRISLVFRGRSIALGSPDELKRRASTGERPRPTLEDAFVTLVEASGAEES